MKNILNLPEEVTNSQVKKALLNVCIKNKKLTEFIETIFSIYSDRTIYAYEDCGWKWDIELDGDYGVFCLCNDDDIDLDEEDGWGEETIEPNFHQYLGDGYKWNKITLDNGKYLFLFDFDDYLDFMILDPENLTDGYAIL